MPRFFVRRLLSALPVVLGVITIVFLLIHLIPGDPVDLILGESARPSERLELRQSLGLNAPLWRQYLDFWGRIFSGSWGQSFARKSSVLPLILERFPATLILALSGLSVALAISVPLGVYAASRRGRWPDHLAMAVALLGLSLPIFVLAPLLVLLFSIRWRWLPVAGFGSAWHLILPALCLGFGLSSLLVRMIRASVLENLSEDFVRTARAKGLGEGRILFQHVLSNAGVPVLSVVTNMLGNLLAGAVLTETLFDWPGIGRLFFSAFQSRDFPVVQGVVLWTSLSYVTISIFSDALFSWMDPRIRLERLG